MSSKAPIKRAATKPATNKETKQQKTANNDDLDDLFADVEVAAPKVVTSATNGAAGDTTLDSTLQMVRNIPPLAMIPLVMP